IDGKANNERCVLSGTRLSAQTKGLVDLLVGKVRTCYKGRSAGGKGSTGHLTGKSCRLCRHGCKYPRRQSENASCWHVSMRACLRLSA
ncbi:hypothetical protein ACQRBH_17250, partial [Bariatricus sp. SGI.161]|uniref:hypothetical protein n=1 Tax=Bariatricus sp. SGI.161 TaxID=3420550 RepID=UPI003D0535B3